MESDDLKNKLGQLSPEQRARLRAMLGHARSNPAQRGIPAVPDAPDYPAGFGQQRIWMLEQLNTGHLAVYNIAQSFRVRGRLDEAALRRAFRLLVHRHEPLRTVFSEKPSGLRQIILGEDVFDLQTVDLSAEHDPEQYFREIAERHASRPFNLEKGPLIRMLFCRMGSAPDGLCVAVHHSVCDGQSLPVLMRDLDVLYSVESGLARPEPQPGTCRYRDFTSWQRDRMGSGGSADAESYWKSVFASLPEPLALPLDFPRPSVQRFDGAHDHVWIDADQVRALEQLGASGGCSLFMTLLAAFQVFLMKYCGQEDVVVGCPVSGRVHPDLENLVGLFINTLAYRGRWTEGQSFASYLGYVRQSVLESLEHQDYPFDHLVDVLKVERDPGRSPLFDVMMGLEDAQDEVTRLGALELKAVQMDPRVSKVDLTFHFRRSAEGLSLDIEYATALFVPERIARMGKLWIGIVEALVRNPDVPLERLDWIPDEERALVLGSWARKSSDYPAGSGIVELFKEQARLCGDAPAIVIEDREYSYRWLDEQSDRMAYALVARHGIGRGDPVGIIMERSEQMVVAVLAVLKTGGAYLPLHVDTPEPRIRGMLEDAATRVVIADAVVCERLSDLPVRWMDAGQGYEEVASGWEPHLGLPSDLAYIMFTSGSTGKPKGTLIEQAGVVRLVKGNAFHQVQPGERILQTGALAFDASTFEIWGALLNGGCVCLPKGRALLDMEEFGRMVRNWRIDTLFLTTGLFNQLVDYSIDSFGGLKTLMTGGERVSVRHVNALRKEYPGLKLLHVYGPTENTTFSTWYRVDRDHDNDIPIGEPIRQSEIYILDRFGMPVPIGVVGELCCGGPGLARGYLNDPLLTARKFVPNPYSASPGSRLYRTGDLGCWDFGGQVVFAGRNDDQVKIRGFRIELGEIEARLRAHSEVEDAVVVARKNGGTHELIAWLVASGPVTRQDLRGWITGTLPDYMVPSHFVMMEGLPLNANGKVDRKRLPDPAESAAPESGAGMEAARTEQEAVLMNQLAVLLGIPAVSRQDNYFAIGGDSIKAIQLGARLGDLGWSLKLTDIFTHPRIADLAATMRRKQSWRDDGVPREALTGSCGMSPIQRWFLDSHPEPHDLFHQITLLRSASPLYPQRVASAVLRLVKRHDALRLVLRKTEDGTGWSHAFGEVPLEVPCKLVDLSSRKGPDVLERMQSETAQLQESIRLDSGLLIGVVLFRLADGDRILFAVHHWAVDGVSWRVLLEEFEMLYSDPEQALPDPGHSFRDWTLACERMMEETRISETEAYWRAVVASVPPCEAPEGRMDRVGFALGTDYTAWLMGPAHNAFHTQVNDVLLAAFQIAWGEVIGGPLALALEGHGRDLSGHSLDVSRCVGWFTSMYPVVLEGDSTGGWSETLVAVKERLRSIPDHGLGYGILNCLKGLTDLRVRLPVSFNYLGVFETSKDGLFQPADEPVRAVVPDHLAHDFGINLVCHVQEGALRGELQYAGNLYRQERIEALASAFELALARILEGCMKQSPVLTASDGSVPGLTQAAYAAILDKQGIRAEDVEAFWEATPMQAGILYHSLQHRHRGDYCDQVRQVVRGRLDPDKFEAAWREVVKRHGVLRSGFWMEGWDVPIQVVFRTRDADFRKHDLSGLSLEAQQARCLELAILDRDEGFDPERQSLLRLTLIQLSDDTHEWILNLHHSILDGWSAGLVMDECLSIYTASVREKPLVLPDPVSFERFVRYRQSQSEDAAIAYWKDLLADGAQGVLPPFGCSTWTDDPDGVGYVACRVGTERCSSISKCTQQWGTTPNALMQATWALWLQAALGVDDVVFGATVSGRDIQEVADIERIVGLLINTIPVRVRDDGRTVRECVDALSRQSAQSREHGLLSLADIQVLAGCRDLIQHAFIFENHPSEADREQDSLLRIETVGVQDPMHFDFGLLVIPDGADMMVRFVARSNRYPERWVERIFDGWMRMIDAALENPESTVAQLKESAGTDRPEQWIVSGTITTEALEEPLLFLSEGAAVPLKIGFCGFNQVFQDLADPTSMLAGNKGGVNALILRLEDWMGSDPDRWQSSLDINIDQFVDGLRPLAQSMPQSRWIVTFVESGRAGTLAPEVVAACAAAEVRIRDRLLPLANVRVRLSHDWEDGISGHLDLYSPSDAGGMPLSPEGYAAVACDLMRVADLSRRKPVKVIAVDADNTLWEGIIGEDGMDGIRMGPERLRFQQRLLDLQQNGVLLALVSKNNRDDVLHVLREHADMLLREEHFVAIQADWGPKSQAIHSLSEELNLGLGSFLFLDDSEMELAEVRSGCPEVACVRVPSSRELDRWIRNLWLLDVGEVTDVDKRRTEMYRNQVQRDSFLRERGSLAAFLSGLELEVEATDAALEDLDRAHQLTSRTNQFNASGWRPVRLELEEWMNMPGHWIKLYRVRDRFGDYGICGAAFCEYSGHDLMVKNLLLSCRAMGRGVEHAMLRQLANRFDLEQGGKVRFQWKRSGRNQPVTAFLKRWSDRSPDSPDEGVFEFDLTRMGRIDILSESGAGGPAEGDVSGGTPVAVEASGDVWERHVPDVFYSRMALEYADNDVFARAVRMRFAAQVGWSVSEEVEAPRTSDEHLVADVFQSVLGLEQQVGRKGHFLALGGHSLKAVMAIGRIQARCGRRISLDAFLSNPTVEAVAGVLSASGLSPERTLEPLVEAEYYNLSRTQKRLWLLCQLRDGAGLAYHMPMACILEGSVDLECLREAFQCLVDRHESLRSCFVEVEGEPRLRVLKSVVVPFIVRKEPVDEGTFRRDAVAWMEEPFDLGSAPLIRVLIQALEGGRVGMVLVMHHIISDGWSLALLGRELSRAYRELRKAAKPRFDPLRIQAKEFAVWQERYLADCVPDRDYWHERFRIPPDPLDLPLDHPRPNLINSKGALFTGSVGGPIRDGVSALAMDRGASPYMILVAGLQLLLHRLSGGDDICIGSPVAGRPHPDFEGVVGCFVNLLPLRQKVNPHDTVSDFLNESIAEIRAALSHSNYPFDQLVGELDLARDMSRAPLFDVLFAYQNIESEEWYADDLQVHPFETGFQPSQYDLAINLFDSGEGWEVRIEYDPVIYEADRMEQFFGLWVDWMRRLPGSTNARIRDLTMVHAEAVSILGNLEQSSAYGVVCRRSMPDWLIQQAKDHPDREALRDWTGAWTYRELEQLTRKMAERLSRKIGAGSPRVAVLGSRSASYVMAMFAVMRAGGVYVPLDPAYPMDRIRFMLEDCGAIGVVAAGDGGGSAGELGLPLWSAQSLLEGDPEDGWAPEGLPDLDPESVAYCLYTSGSTGRPKGVVVSHQAFSTMIAAQCEAFDVQGGDHCAQFASMSFDASLSEIFLPFSQGASLHIAPDRAREDVSEFVGWLRDSEVTVVTLPPAFLRAIGKIDLHPLRVLITAGEAPDPELARFYASRLLYVNAYGPTEASVCATVHWVRADCRMPAAVGRPLGPVAVRILDAEGRRVPRGCDGEICISGPTVADGYWNRPDLTASVFVPDPYETGQRMYRTGDRGRWGWDGQLEFRGRMDFQVKLRGFRIETGEVENVLREVEGVTACCVLVHADNLVGVVAGKVSAEVLSSACRRRLPAYMVPSRMVVVDSLPISPNGKVDRKALGVRLAQSEIAEQDEAPMEGREQLVALAWSSVSGVKVPGRSSRFFCLGGDSIKALQVIVFLRQHGWKGTLRDLFASDVLSDFAASLEPCSGRSSSPGNSHDQTDDAFELNPVQRWFFSAHVTSPWEHFNMAMRWVPSHPLDPVKVGRAVAQLAVLYPALRSCFPLGPDGRRTGKILSPDAVGTLLIQAEGGRDQDFSGPFDLERGPLVRFVLRSDGSALLAVAHHLVVDWVSWRVLMDAFTRVYAAFDQETADPIDFPVDRGLFVRTGSMREWARLHPDDRSWWQDYLARMPEHRVPCGRYRDAHLREIRFPDAVSSGWGMLGRDTQAMLLAAFSSALFELGDAEAVSVLMESHGRHEWAESDDFSHSVGWYTALYPVVVERPVDGGSHLGQVKDALACVPSHGMGYGVWTTQDANPLPSVHPFASLNYLGSFDQEQGAGAFWKRIEGGLAGTISGSFERDHPVDINVWFHEGRLQGVLACYEPAWVDILCDRIPLYLADYMNNGNPCFDDNSDSMSDVRRDD